MPRTRYHVLLLLIASLALVIMLLLIPGRAFMAPADEPSYYQFLPLILNEHPLRPPTPTPTATPTTPLCPLDDVTGVYDVTYDNIMHDCPATIPDIPPATLTIIQNGGTLTWRSATGDTVGSYDPDTGAFAMVVTTTEDPCTWGCVSTTTGTFNLGEDPMTFAGVGGIRLGGPFGTTICSATYDMNGTRTDCTIAR